MKRGFPRPIRVGSWLAGIYVVIVLVVYWITALTTKPGNVGLDWIPFVMLAMPWAAMGQAQDFLIPGLIANALLLFAVGALIGVVTEERAASQNGSGK
jgi:hypothetical protein